MTGEGERPPLRAFSPRHGEGDHRKVAFDRVNAAALANAEAVVRGMLPDGRPEGAEWVAINPRRPDRRLGSFKVNLNSGKWADFATGDRGGDLVSLAAFVGGVGQREAALRLGNALGVNVFV